MKLKKKHGCRASNEQVFTCKPTLGMDEVILCWTIKTNCNLESSANTNRYGMLEYYKKEKERYTISRN